MAKKKITLESLAAQMQKGFASVEAKIEKIDARMERGFGGLADDIAEKHDVAAQEPQRVAALHDKLMQWNGELIPPLWTSPTPSATKPAAPGPWSPGQGRRQ